MTLPKYKELGLITAHASSGQPTASASSYSVEWVTNLQFRNSTATAALCIFPSQKDPKYNGLHLAPDAARELANELETQSQILTAVDVDNHRSGVVQVWERFSDSDAIQLTQRIRTAMVGH